MVLTREAVQELLRAKKSIVRPLSWARRLDAGHPEWMQFVSAVSSAADGVVLEGVRVIAQYRPKVGVRPSVSNVGLLLGSGRIYAVDSAIAGDHKNDKAGRGRTFWDKFVGGVHEHSWSKEGYGYAEPLTLSDPSQFEAAWEHFLRGAGLSYEFPFVHPDTALRGGQEGLDI